MHIFNQITLGLTFLRKLLCHELTCEDARGHFKVVPFSEMKKMGYWASKHV